ncbi:CRISPR-associated endonuclease Cas3'' (plasmid) [Azospirillum argentinense]|uniref:CRISPR-associated endonuclease Cas3 n=1 Tax=Azospirillum argentinense TaxID=2970906 RepID=A0A4D8PZX4_9PROT|nr:CRISPR-associated endonuclease Cas3'' [Azospirillum argentinense]QCO00140.1 CRISPR-associated endonuclease Cas3'' [Azospirillum argentinense]
MCCGTGLRTLLSWQLKCDDALSLPDRHVAVHEQKRANYLSPWGKHGDQPDDCHHLAHHCADVAACFEAIIALPVVRARIETAGGAPLSPCDRARLAAIAFLHDVGKLHPGFQAKGWSADDRSRHHPLTLHGHLAEGMALLMRQGPMRLWQALGLSDAAWWDDAHPFILASLAHHGRPVNSLAMAGGWDPCVLPGAIYDPADGARTMGAALRAWFPDAFSNDGDGPPPTPRLQHLFAGLVALADWLGSDTRFFKFEKDFRDDYIVTAREKAAEAVSRIRLDIESLRRPAADRADFETITGFAAPAPHQRAVAILEAETGAGKTEAAFWRFARLFAAGAVDGLYVALPTRSAAIQIHGRVNRMLERLTGPDGLKAVLAVPGYLKVGDVEGESLPHWRVRWDDAGERAEDELAARWAAESAKRFLAAPVAVGTVDQAMLAGLQVKHAHLRGACLSRCLLVIDEVHASDRYMTEVQARLLENHLGVGGHALLMSATLGSWARTRWLKAGSVGGGSLKGGPPPDFATAIAAPYPAVWTGRSAAPIDPGGDGARTRRKTVAMTLHSGWSPEHAAGLALAAARGGAKVLVVRNTVTAAVATWEAIRVLGGDGLLLRVADGPALHHSRFAWRTAKRWIAPWKRLWRRIPVGALAA